MVIQIVAGVARGVATGARVAGKATATAVRAGTKGAASAARGTEKSAESATRTTTASIKAGMRKAKQVAKTSYRTGRAFSRAARNVRSSNEMRDYGYTTRGDPKRFSVADPRRSLARAFNAVPAPRFVKRIGVEMMPMGGKTSAARLGIIQRTPRWARRQQVKNRARAAAGFSKKPLRPPISKTEGRVMLGVAVVFDLLPILFIVLPIVAFMYTAGSNPGCTLNWKIFSCLADMATRGLGGAAGIAAILFFSPFIYTIGSVYSVLMGSLVFVVWIGAFRGVNPLRILMFLPFEMVPLINLLPFFTGGVWRTLRIVEREYAQVANPG